MRNRKSFWVALCWCFLLALSGEPASAGESDTRVSVPGGAYINLKAPALRKMLGAKDFLFVNVHVPYEGEIAGTDAFIPFDQVEQQLQRLPAKKDRKILLYCRSGRMSDIAARTLVRLGYTNLWHLDEGMIGWTQQGYPLIHGQGR